MQDQNYMPCTLWTIKIEDCGMVYHISHIAFSDIAHAAAKGIKELLGEKAKIKVYFAQAK